MKQCLCVFSRILGWRVFGDYVDKGLARHSSIAAFDCLDYDPAVARLPVPWFRRFSDGLATTYRLRRAIRSKKIDFSRYDTFIFQGHDLAVSFRGRTNSATGIIADVTPAIAARRERGLRGFRPLLKRIWLSYQDRYVYKPIFSRCRSFLVLSKTVKDSLVSDYGVDAKRIHVVGPPVFELVQGIEPQARQSRPVLLFVGNDFERKGGYFLLDLYQRFFKDTADFWIVSNGIDADRAGPDVRLFSNISVRDVLGLMLRSHVFLFPSRHDELGLVLAEAACAGLPIVACETGGQAEYVRVGENGYLLAPEDGAEQWKASIEATLRSEGEWRRMSQASQDLGRRLCSQDRFDRKMASFVNDIFS